ncbi:hypothetical protein [Kosakonia sacchari]|uniref:Uncharacterized protein n=1 Tax=Kosakonia sacchari TaxID=1158459 RepID=A0ABZ0MWT0_9ENTR|nr:hypothetical protein [Kosakonia sacchari]WOZ79992.1 hypothetical protein Q8Y70_23855 [Kosakonia sacchari]
MKKKGIRILPETQASRLRSEMRALNKAQKKGITEKALANEMTKDMANPDSAETLIQAASVIRYMNGIKQGETPLSDAMDRLTNPCTNPGGAGEPEPA